MQLQVALTKPMRVALTKPMHVGVEGGRGKTWKDKLRLDLVTEIAVVLGLGTPN